MKEKLFKDSLPSPIYYINFLLIRSVRCLKRFGKVAVPTGK